jgi:hypothetical protein
MRLCADNATRASWPLIEAACGWVECGPCLPHCMDLLLEDIFKAFPFLQDHYKKANAIRKFVNNHQVSLII